MCGISGIISRDKELALTAQHLKRMSDTIRHRGKDGEGFLLANANQFTLAHAGDTPADIIQHTGSSPIDSQNEKFQVQFAHRRLSIIDTSITGHQPMSDSENKCWITYNGEIYNYKSLRDELKGKGYSFRTQTDTEVILHAYAEYGEQCVDYFDGMWSFVIYDTGKNLLFGSRDRSGVKPFYYYFNESYFAFGSEQKALLQLPFITKQINPRAVFDFLVLGRLEDEEEGLFKNIFELKPSHSFTLTLSDWKFTKRKYYTLPFNPQIELVENARSLQYIEKITELTSKAVQLRLQSDAPVGSCLSGGVDSSVIVCIVNKMLQLAPIEQVGEKQKLFTAVFPGQSFDESGFAKTVAEQIRSSWYQTEPLPNNFLNEFETLNYAQDLPVFSTSSYAQYCVMKLASENGVKVVLDGQGGDELFGGYKKYFPDFLNEFGKNNQYRLRAREKRSFESIDDNKAFLQRLLIRDFIRRRIKTIGAEELKYINPELLRANGERMELLRPKKYNNLNERLADEYSGFELKELLRREDRNGMHFGIEARTPFADDIHLTEYLFSIPGTYKIQHGKMKYLLRESFKQLLPEKIYNRHDKKGFASPNNIWLDELKDQFRSYFTDDLKDYMNVSKLMKDYDKYFSVSKKPESFRHMKFASFAIWNKVFFNY